MTEDIVPVRNALLSVYNKTGIVSMARVLHECGAKLYSSGGTATELGKANLPVTDIAQYTGFPALFGHRVVTLHPKVHGGIMYRRDNKQDREEARQHGVVSFDLVVVNLYPVQEAIGKADATIDEVVEKTDIGGPTMLRGAAKNHKYVAVVVDLGDYASVTEKIRLNGGLTYGERLGLAQKVFSTMAAYDTAVAGFYEKKMEEMAGR